MRNFNLLLKNKWKENKFVCVGLDSDYTQIPSFLKKGKSSKSVILEFNKKIVLSTHDLVCAYKMQSSFYEAEGTEGLEALKETVKFIKKKFPDIPLILDAKRADIGNTNLGYTKAIFEYLGFDAVTVNPYLGMEAVEPFLWQKDKGIIILVKTSNPGAGEFQDLKVNGKPLYQIVAEHVAKIWNKNGNCGVVVGATYPKELKIVRKIVGNMPILIPGIGAQGGEVKNMVLAGKDSQNQGMIINSSRGIIFAPNPREATLTLHKQIVQYLTN